MQVMQREYKSHSMLRQAYTVSSEGHERYESVTIRWTALPRWSRWNERLGCLRTQEYG